MKCSNWQEQLNKWMDGRLAGENIAALQAHLSSCQACAHEKSGLERLKALTSAAAALPAGTKLSPQFDMRFRARLRRETAAPERAWMRVLKPVLAGAALAAGLFVAQHNLSPRRDAAPAVASETEALLDATLAYARMDEERLQAEARARELVSGLL